MSPAGEKRRGLHQLLDSARDRQAGIVVVMDPPVQDDPQELVEDLMATTTSVSTRIDDKRGKKKVASTVRQAIAT
jgi:predicted site-specific integrase-resolvase